MECINLLLLTDYIKDVKQEHTTMPTPQFQKLMVILFFVLIASLVAYGIYCRRKSHSYIGTGRAAEIEQWSIKAGVSWVAIFILISLALIDFL